MSRKVNKSFDEWHDMVTSSYRLNHAKNKGILLGLMETLHCQYLYHYHDFFKHERSWFISYSVSKQS